MQIEVLKNLLGQAVMERNKQRELAQLPFLFEVEIKLKPDHAIHVFIDAAHSLTIDDCIAVSRFIEGHLDREEEDFSLQVSSAGLDQPFKVLAQYQKNIGRKIKVMGVDGTFFEGKLLEVDEQGIKISPEVKGKKGKAKAKAVESQEAEPISLSYNGIKETHVVIEF